MNIYSLVICLIFSGCAHLSDLAATDAQMASLGEPAASEEAVNSETGITADGYPMVTILNYHDFKDISQTTMQVSQKDFEAQMRYLKENGFHVISLQEFFDYLDLKFSLPEKAVVITIDDGWRSTYTIAFPILKQYGFTATVFIYTDFISARNPAALSWEMLREMHKHGLDVQAHSKTHQAQIPWKREGESEDEYRKRLERELLFPKELIEQQLGNSVQFIAYPYGQFNESFVEAARRHGYRGGLTVAGATVGEGAIVKKKGNPIFIDPFEVRRVQILAGTTVAEFAKKFKSHEEEKIYQGQYDFLFRLAQSSEDSK